MSLFHVRFLSGEEGVVDLSQCESIWGYDVRQDQQRHASPCSANLSLPCLALLLFFSCVAGPPFFFCRMSVVFTLPVHYLLAAFLSVSAGFLGTALSSPISVLRLLPALLLTVHRLYFATCLLLTFHRLHRTLSYCPTFIVFALIAAVLSFIALPCPQPTLFLSAFHFHGHPVLQVFAYIYNCSRRYLTSLCISYICVHV